MGTPYAMLDLVEPFERIELRGGIQCFVAPDGAADDRQLEPEARAELLGLCSVECNDVRSHIHGSLFPKCRVPATSGTMPSGGDEVGEVDETRSPDKANGRTRDRISSVRSAAGALRLRGLRCLSLPYGIRR